MKSKILAVSAVVVLGVVGSGTYMKYKTDKESEALVTAIHNINSKLPPGYTQKNTHNKTFFKTEGVYTLLNRNENNENIEKVILTYSMTHNVNNVFTDKYPVNIDIKLLNEPTIVLSNPNEPYAKISGLYSSKGLNLIGKSQDMTVTMKDSNTEFKATGQEFVVDYNKIMGDVGFKFKVAKLEDEQLGEVFNDIKIDFKYNMLNALIGSLGVSIDSVEQGYATFKDLNFMFNVAEKENDVDAGLKIKVGDIRSGLLEDKVFSLDMDVGIGKIDADFYRTLATMLENKNSDNELTEVEALENTTTMMRAFNKLYKKGLTFDVNKLHLKTSTDELKTNLHLVISPQVENNDLKTRTSFNSDLYLKSDVISSSINFVPPELHGLFKDNRNEFSLSVAYKDSNLRTTSVLSDKESQDYMTSLLMGVEQGINEGLIAVDNAFNEMMIQNEKFEELLETKKKSFN